MTDRPKTAAHESANSMAMLPREYRVMFEFEEDYWWYRGLRVLLTKLLERYAPHDRNAPVLDAGCGTGANLQLLAQYGDAWGVDIAEQAIRFSRMRSAGMPRIPAERTLIGSLLEMPFPDHFFQLAISFDVLCNIQDDVRGMMELNRVLAPGAPLILQLPAYRFLWSAHDVAVGHKHRYTARDLTEKLTRAGFRVEFLTYINITLFPLIAAMRLARRSAANGNAHSDLVPLPRPINSALTRLFTAEMRAAARLRLPYGLSLLAVARKI